jgi:lipopolysaccharide transport system ATP-binding protein
MSKEFVEYDSGFKRVLSWFGMNFTPEKSHKVLKNISLSIDSGESVGIIGSNGAGKSTILKLITGILRPTTGDIKITGNISAILELGMGFHQDLTGRQNTYNSLGLMGRATNEIDAVISQIEEFAEIGEYFDEPVRSYSSGMQMRVAFSVATAFKPEVLIVDEALSVGDTYFQHKSFSRIKEFQESGTTLLIVSHDRNAIQGLCNRAVLLDDGIIIKDGPPDEVFDFYNAIIAEKENSTVKVKKVAGNKVQTTSGSGDATVTCIEMLNEKNESIDHLNVGQTVYLRICIEAKQKLPSLTLGYLIKDRLGQDVYGTNTFYLQKKDSPANAGDSTEYTFKFTANLGVGSYSITTALHAGSSHLVDNYEWKDLAFVFNIVNMDKVHFSGGTWLPPILGVK